MLDGVQFLENSPNPGPKIDLTSVTVGLTSLTRVSCPHTSQTNVVCFRWKSQLKQAEPKSSS
jgi:hypothetical protein